MVKVGLWIDEPYVDGPLHAYPVGTAVPDGVDVKLTVPPTQAGPSLAAAIARVFTVTTTVLEAIQPEGLVTVTEYVPPIAVVTPVNTGVALEEVNPAGPFQE